MLTLADELPTCGLHGHQLNFSVAVLRTMGEALAEEAIIHELGHASLCAEHDADHGHLRPLIRGGGNCVAIAVERHAARDSVCDNQRRTRSSSAPQ